MFSAWSHPETTGGATVHAPPVDSNLYVCEHGPSGSEAGDVIAQDRGDQLADRSRLVFIDEGGGFAAPFFFIPFHGGRYGD